MLKGMLSLVMVMVATVTGFAEPTLDSLKQTYEVELQKIRDAHEAKLNRLLDTYGRSLGSAIEKLKQDGDPDAVLQAISERRRFEQERVVPEQPNSRLPAGIQECQFGFNDALKKANIEKGKKFIELTRRYVSVLDKRMRSLVTQEKLDLSLNVKQEKERVEFVMADTEIQLRKMVNNVSFPPDLKRGLVLHYPFDLDEGDKVTDKSGKRHGHAPPGRRRRSITRTHVSVRRDWRQVLRDDGRARHMEPCPVRFRSQAALRTDEGEVAMLEAMLSLVILVGATAVRGAEHTLDSLKQTYEVEVQKIEAVHDAKLKGLLGTYGRSLDKAVEILKKKGDPDAVLLAVTERKRFGGERTVPATANTKLPQLLQDVQNTYVDAVKKATVEKAKRFLDLTEKYDATLQKLMGALTAQEKLDLALNVKAERKRVAFVSADVEGKLKGLLKIPRDAVRVQWHFYKVFEGKVSWHQAKAQCERVGGHLATVTSQDENQVVSLLAERRRFWFGATKADDGRTWKWVTGEAFRFSDWLPGSKEGRNRDENYLVTHEDGRWHDAPKTHPPCGYICEWEI